MSMVGISKGLGVLVILVEVREYDPFWCLVKLRPDGVTTDYCASNDNCASNKECNHAGFLNPFDRISSSRGWTGLAPFGVTGRFTPRRPPKS